MPFDYFDRTITSPARAGTDIVYRNNTAYSWAANINGTTNQLFKLQHNPGAPQSVAASGAVGSGPGGTFTLFGFVQPGVLIGIRDVDLAGTTHVSTFDADTLTVISTVQVPAVVGYTFQRYYLMHDGWHVPDGSGQVVIWYYSATAGYKAYEAFVTAGGTIPGFAPVTLLNTFGPTDTGHMYSGQVWCGQMRITTGPNAGQSRARAFDMGNRNWTAPQNLPAGTTDQYTVYFQNDYLANTEHFGAEEWTPMYAGSGSNIGAGPSTRYICKMRWDDDFFGMTNTGDVWAVPDAATWQRVFAIRVTTGECVVMLTKVGPVVDGNSTNIVELWYDVFGTPELVGTYQDSSGFAASSRPYVRVSTKGSFMMLWNSDGTHRQWQRGAILGSVALTSVGSLTLQGGMMDLSHEESRRRFS